MDREQLKHFAKNAQAMIHRGAAEDRLRHYLSSCLTHIFPDAPWWVQAHMEGIETHVHYSSGQTCRDGYVDTFVGKTAIEYEKNLNLKYIFDLGYDQVKEYCAALCNLGISPHEVLGVLSDTVRWFGYSVTIDETVPKSQMYGPEHVKLHQTAFVDLSLGTDAEFDKFELFVGRFLNRDQSRLLNANTLVMDFGMESNFYRQHISVFRETVLQAMEEKPDYAALIQQVWQNFVAYLGVSDYGSFSMETYVNEFYLVTVAKILCVNILAGKPVLSETHEIFGILNGEYFLSQNIFNFVEYDYFGWLNNPPYAVQIVECVSEIQHRLVAYDFSCLQDQDLFGRLLAQLADKEHRLMLGQEFTPHWIAEDMAESCLERISDDTPHILDMCCGSGVFLIEAMKAVRRHYKIEAENYSDKKDAIIFSCVMGFDIDPLAVMLAKVNWVMAMRDLFSVHSGSITVPVYHADSLFAATPISSRSRDENGGFYTLHFDNHEVTLPAFLLSPSYCRVFDSFMAKSYRLAMARADSPCTSIDSAVIRDLIVSVEDESDTPLSKEHEEILNFASQKLVVELEQLQREKRNGIWYFILANSYRPRLMTHQFNCIVSNPPWMAMSKLAGNPYKDALLRIAKKYGIRPLGPSHPHMEMATVFLLSAVDRYLKEGSPWSCVMPGSILNGLNHEPFRREKYRSSKAALSIQITDLWELPQNTFKNKAIVISGFKSGKRSPKLIAGRIYKEAKSYDPCIYTLADRENRSAWTTDIYTEDFADNHFVKFSQGCDLFPRTVLFHRFTKRANGNWDISPIERSSELYYLINESKKVCCNDLSADNFDKNYVFDAYISKHLSPFYMANPAKVLMPGKKAEGEWKAITPSEVALMNTGASYVFQRIRETLQEEMEDYLENKINIYGKLEKQDFTSKDWLVLSNAGGSHPCAAYLDLNSVDRSRIIIDQTLYWYLADSEEEAVYVTGLLNSDVLSDTIKDFQPEGGFGKRHIHSLPYQLIPAFDMRNSSIISLIENSRRLIEEWMGMCSDAGIARLLSPDSGSLNSRRKRQQAAIRSLPGYTAYEASCRAVLRSGHIYEK